MSDTEPAQQSDKPPPDETLVELPPMPETVIDPKPFRLTIAKAAG